MKIAYLYNRPAKAAQDWGADRVFIDTPETARAERADMLAHGLREGDVLILASDSDLGRGAEVPAIKARLAEMGVEIEVRKAPPGKPGRRAAFKLNGSDMDTARALWKSGLEQKHVLQRVADMAGVDSVSRQQMYRLFGNRY